MAQLQKLTEKLIILLRWPVIGPSPLPANLQSNKNMKRYFGFTKISGYSLNARAFVTQNGKMKRGIYSVQTTRRAGTITRWHPCYVQGMRLIRSFLRQCTMKQGIIWLIIIRLISPIWLALKFKTPNCIQRYCSTQNFEEF